MTDKEDTRLEIYAHNLTYLSIPNNPMGSQSYTYSLDVCLYNILLFLFDITLLL